MRWIASVFTSSWLFSQSCRTLNSTICQIDDSIRRKVIQRRLPDRRSPPPRALPAPARWRRSPCSALPPLHPAPLPCGRPRIHRPVLRLRLRVPGSAVAGNLAKSFSCRRRLPLQSEPLLRFGRALGCDFFRFSAAFVSSVATPSSLLAALADRALRFLEPSLF
jgi:hypothetical protein